MWNILLAGYDCKTIPGTDLTLIGGDYHYYPSTNFWPFKSLDNVCNLAEINDTDSLIGAVVEVDDCGYYNSTYDVANPRYYWFKSNVLECSSWIWRNNTLIADASCSKVHCGAYCALRVERLKFHGPRDCSYSVKIIPYYDQCSARVLCQYYYGKCCYQKQRLTGKSV